MGSPSHISILPLSDGPEDSNCCPRMIRGHVCDDTINQLWTAEVQRSLNDYPWNILLRKESLDASRKEQMNGAQDSQTGCQPSAEGFHKTKRKTKKKKNLAKSGLPVPSRTPKDTHLLRVLKKQTTAPFEKHLLKPSVSWLPMSHQCMWEKMMADPASIATWALLLRRHQMETIFLLHTGSGGFQGGSAVKNPPASAGNVASIRGSRRSPGGGNRPTPVFSPAKSHEQRRLAGYSPCGLKESDMT